MNDWFEAEQRVERAQQLSESMQWVEALAEIDVALSINPHNAAWHAHRGCILEELGRIAEAAEAYEQALKIDPDDRDVAAAFGVTLARQERFARALEVFEGLARTYPDFEPAYCNRIHIYAELGRHDQAEEMFYLAQELTEECPHCFFHVGASLAARGQHRRAVFCWRRVLELDPDYLGVNRRIARAYRAQGKLDRAREYYLREVREDAGNTDLLFEFAELTLESGQTATAAAKLAQILELEPSHARARLALGKILLRRGQPAQALECIKRIGRHPGYRNEVPEYDLRMGEALFQLRRFSEACDHLRCAVEASDSDPDVLMLLGDCLLAADEISEAADVFRKVLAKDARRPHAHHNLGVCLFRMNQFDAGLEHCLDAIRLRPDYVVAMHNAAVAHVQIAQWYDAKTMLRRALRFDPHNEQARRLLNRLWLHRLRHYGRKLVAVFGIRLG